MTVQAAYQLVSKEGGWASLLWVDFRGCNQTQLVGGAHGLFSRLRRWRAKELQGLRSGVDARGPQGRLGSARF